MACKKCNFYSPESTVSSLLASCSLNSSSSFYPNSSVQYKDKLYNSASQALEAYIEDFDLSLVSPKIRTGKIYDQTELILLKAKRALESSAEEITSALKKDGSPCTADVLDAERSWENVPVKYTTRTVPIKCGNMYLESCESTFSGGNHHGPVEALKLMLFNLQAVQQSLTPNRTAEQNEFKKVSCLFPLNLELALHHLSRLKGLVDNTASKEDPKEGCQEEEKEKVA
uniref:Chromosome 18 open reading frame 54 n=1 Tax=Sphenodon punctatus TaxID=8508 RepID=A0A8D0HGD2_SPHPU